MHTSHMSKHHLGMKIVFKCVATTCNCKRCLYWNVPNGNESAIELWIALHLHDCPCIVKSKFGWMYIKL
jgi:hypothetical protein